MAGFQRDCLCVIADRGSPKGLAIKDDLDGYYGGEINHGRLVDKGLLEKGTIDDRTNSYTLTQRGERELEARRECENRRLEDIDLEATA